MRKTGPASSAEDNFPSSAGLFILVLWMACATVSVVGFIIPYSRPHATPPPPPPVLAEVLDVRLTSNELPALAPELAREPEPLALPPPLEALAPQPAPALIAVAE